MILILSFSCTENKSSQVSLPNNSDTIKVVSNPTPKFPEDWIGTYKGDLQWFSKDKITTIPMTIEIQIIDTLPNTYLWRSTYDSTARFPKVVKDYYLVHPDSLAEGHYLIDEKDGIYLDMILIDNSFYSNFEVGNSSLMTIDRLQADGSIFHEIVSSPQNAVRESGTMSDGQYFGVKSYSKIGTQKAILKRQK